MFNRNRSISAASWTCRFALLALAALAVVLALTGCSGSGVKDSMDKYSWDELSAIASEISTADSDEAALQIATDYHLIDSSGKLDGTTKSVALSDGTTAHVAIAGFRADDASDGSKAGITFVFTDAPVVHAMDESASNDGGWEKSEMRSWLNGEFAGMLPSDMKSAIKAVDKKTNSSAYTTPGAVSSTSDKLWLLSFAEIAGTPSPNSLIGGSGIPAETYGMEGKQYQLFSDKGVSAGEPNDVLVRTFTGAEGNGLAMSGSACPWWLRSLSMTWTSGFAACSNEGDPQSAWVADHEIGVAPGFCL